MLSQFVFVLKIKIKWSLWPFPLHEISVLIETILGHLRYLLTDVPPQPNSPPDYVSDTGRTLPNEGEECLTPQEAPSRGPALHDQISSLTLGVVVSHDRPEDLPPITAPPKSTHKV